MIDYVINFITGIINFIAGIINFIIIGIVQLCILTALYFALKIYFDYRSDNKRSKR